MEGIVTLRSTWRTFTVSLVQKDRKWTQYSPRTLGSDATTAVNIFTDWVTAFMPIPLLWNVQLNRNTKVSVAVLLGLGFFASISACVRLKYTVNLTASEDYLCMYIRGGYFTTETC